MKWAYLVSRSMTTIMVVYLWEGGKPSMKSMEMSDHTRVGTGKGCRRPAGDILSDLFC